METDEDAWGQLVSLTDVESSPIPLIANKISIGRAKDCDISLSENKLVSGRHCFLEKEANGEVFLHDTSKNGTLLNLNYKISNGDKKELKHGDEFYVVFKKNEDNVNVGYMYQSMEELQREMNETQEYSPDLGMDATLVDDEVNLLQDDEEDKAATAGNKRRKSSDEHPEEPKSKRRKTSDDEKEDKGKCEKEKENEKEKEKEKEQNCAEKQTSSGASSKPTSSGISDTDEIEEALICTICQELLHDCISLQPCMHSFCAGCYSDWMDRSNECPTCRMKVERINKNHIVNNLIEAYLKEHPDKKRDEDDLKELDAKNKISRDMLYPKNRTLYSSGESGSESDDGDNSSSYTSPAACPPPAPLFAFGTPVFGTVKPARTVCRQCPDYVDPTPANAPANAPANPGIIGTIRNVVVNVLGANQEDAGSSTATAANQNEGTDGAGSLDSESTQPLGTADDAQPGPSNQDNKDVKAMPTPVDYKCSATQNHVLCQCCLHPMPDRRTEYFNDPTHLPAQQCTICYRVFCHAYWGCKRVDCNGCIGKFKDLNFGKKCLTNLILDNPYESEILKNYLEKKNISVKEVLEHCLGKMATGEFTCKDNYRFAIGGNTPLCYACGLRNFKDLAYLYRFNIPKEELPAEVVSRSDCYWGKNCRTQRNKPDHARRFSHICDQTRTA